MQGKIREYRRKQRRLVRIAAVGLAGWIVAEAARAPRAPGSAERPRSLPPGPVAVPPQQAPASQEPPRAAGMRRALAAFGFAVLFFAGASFTAVAGDRVGSYLGDDPMVVADEAAQTDGAAGEPAPVEQAPPAEQAPAEQAPAGDNAPVESAEGVDALPVDVAPAPEPQSATSTEPPAAAPAADAQPAERAASSSVRPRSTTPALRAAAEPRTVAPSPRPDVAPTPAAEVEGHGHAHAGFSTVWLDRELADPTPRSLRLTPAFARRLRATAKAEGVHWSLVLAALRADGNRRSIPARAPTLTKTARDLAAHGARRDAWAAVLAIGGRTAYADRAVALATYYRAVGLRTLVRGLQAERERLVARLLADERVAIYAGGREDLAAGRVDVRVVALIAYLRQGFGQVTVSSLISGHRYYSRPGVVSAHMYGAAVDIAVLGGVPVLGNQGRGSLVERAVRDILLLPAELLPRQVISLLALGGPSFPLADHHDHIHVGY